MKLQLQRFPGGEGVAAEEADTSDVQDADGDTGLKDDDEDDDLDEGQE